MLVVGARIALNHFAPGVLLGAMMIILEPGGPRGSVIERMAPTLITCGAQLADGRTCHESASVVKTQYVYDRKPIVGNDPDYSLKAIHYTAMCPHCGERTIIEADRKVE